ncbi:MAG: hypothetical protein AB1593_10780 [Pseudomonadota bacterium]
MRRRSRADSRIYDELNLTPLMDLAWNLLIVFIIMATASVQGISVDLPGGDFFPCPARLQDPLAACGVPAPDNSSQAAVGPQRHGTMLA